jgi:hypothetical protein
MEKLNKIGIIGTQCIGKTTLIQDMKEMWPMFSTPTKTYRDLIKEKKLPVNKNGTKESQQAILDFLVDEAMANYKGQKMIFDRTPLDNLVYSLWLYDKQCSDVDEKFIDKSVIQVREALKFYSVIFYLPFCRENDVLLESAPNRDVDPVYRSEIGHLFEGIYKSWEQGASRFFDSKDSPAIIPIFGNRKERIAMMSLYINEKGEFFGEDQSVVTDFLQKEIIRKNLFGEK